MTGVLVLAAGNSSRMGRLKQVLPFRNSTLLRHAAELGIATGLGPTLVVLGAEPRQCLEALGDLGVRTFINPHWEQGMGSSIAAGVAEMVRLAPQIDGVLILVHDQPAIPAERLCQLVAARRENDLVVAAEYDDLMGVPAYFRRELFDELRRLGGPQGTRKILQANSTQLLRFDLPEAKFDIDTPTDYQRVCGTRSLKI